MRGGFYLMTPTEIARGFVTGAEEPLVAATSSAPPREVLEGLLRDALTREPCGIAFSGGRDSSLLLAVATHVARRDGLPAPIPITRRFPSMPDTDETAWQESVIRHLGLREWHHVELDDELDILGPSAQQTLRRHGVVWTPFVNSAAPLYAGLEGGTLVDGEGGDDVLGIDRHRIGWTMNLLRYPRPLRLRRLKDAVWSLTPRRARHAHVLRVLGDEGWEWLRPTPRADAFDAVAAESCRAPLSFAASVRAVPTRRDIALALHNRRLHAKECGVTASSPLLDSEFVHSIARLGGVLGPGGRTAVMGRIAGDLLPASTIGRLGKVYFNTPYIGRHTIDFARDWDGSGVDPELVDIGRLVDIWRSGTIPPVTSALLQQAWLARAGSN